MKSYLVYSMFFYFLVYVNLDMIACDIKKLNFQPRTGVRNTRPNSEIESDYNK